MSPTGVDISGITTAATLKATTGIVTTLTATTGIVTTLTANTTKITTGIVTTLTATTGIVTTLTTNTLTANSTAKVGSGVTLSPDGDVFTTGITTSSTVIVGSGVTISESGIEASGIGITCANINGAQIGGRRNLMINGAMQIAQRGTSSTSDGYTTVDRFHVEDAGGEESVTREQVSVTSGGAYNSGFRNCLKLTNGNQTGGAGATDYIQILYRFEAQDIANSGWNYPSTSSFVTLSFWMKSSVAQAFSGSLRTADGTSYSYKFDTPSLSANTWTKVTKTIPGNSNLTFDDDIGDGLAIFLYPFLGTTYTSSNANTETWISSSGDTYSNNITSTWWTTNDATFEVTGFQLEVWSQPTPFEHRTIGDELALCQRYYQVGSSIGAGYGSANGYARAGSVYATPMRTTPTLATTNSGSGSIIASGTSNTGFYVTYGSLGGSSAGIFSFIANAEI